MNDESITGDGVAEVQNTSTNAGDAAVAKADFLNPEPRFKCEGYNEMLGLCPREATKEARYGGFVHKLCKPCHEEFLSDQNQWKSEQFDEEQ